MTTLLDKSRKDEYVDDIKEDYEDIRDDHYDSLKVRFWYLYHMQFVATTCAPLITLIFSSSTAGMLYSLAQWAWQF